MSRLADVGVEVEAVVGVVAEVAVGVEGLGSRACCSSSVVGGGDGEAMAGSWFCPADCKVTAEGALAVVLGKVIEVDIPSP